MPVILTVDAQTTAAVAGLQALADRLAGLSGATGGASTAIDRLQGMIDAVVGVTTRADAAVRTLGEAESLVADRAAKASSALDYLVRVQQQVASGAMSGAEAARELDVAYRNVTSTGTDLTTALSKQTAAQDTNTIRTQAQTVAMRDLQAQVVTTNAAITDMQRAQAVPGFLLPGQQGMAAAGSRVSAATYTPTMIAGQTAIEQAAGVQALLDATEARQNLLDNALSMGVVPPIGALGGQGAKISAARQAEAAAAQDAEDARIAMGGRLAFGGLAETVGVSGRLAAALPMLMGPEALALLAGGYGAFKIGQAGMGYQSAVTQTVAQSDPNRNATAVQDQTAKLSADILKFAETGKSFYDPTVLAQSLEPMLTHFSESAVMGALPALQTLAKQNNAPDLSTVSALIPMMAQNFGLGSKSTGSQLTALTDFISMAEQLTTLSPGTLTTSLPRLYSSIQGTGISKEESTALFIKAAAGNPSGKIDANSMARLFTDLTTKNTVGATKEFTQLGLATGPGAVQAYGGIFPYLQQIQNASLAAAGGDVQQQRKILAELFPQTGNQAGALNAFLGIFQGGGLQQAAGYMSLSGSGGNTARVAQELALGDTQQLSMAQNHLSAEFDAMGLQIDAKVIPALDKMVTASAGFFDWVNQHTGAGSALGAFGHNMDVFMGQIGINPSMTPTMDMSKLIAYAKSRAPHPTAAFEALTGNTPTAGSHASTPGAVYSPALGRNISPGEAAYFRRIGVNPTGPSRATIDANAASVQRTAAARARFSAADEAHAAREDFAGIGGGLIAGPSGTPAPAAPHTPINTSASTMGLHASEEGLGYQQAYLLQQQALQTNAGKNMATVNARATINSMLASGLNGMGNPLSALDLQGAQQALGKALLTSAYTPEQRAGIYATESKKIGKYEYTGAKQALDVGVSEYKAGTLDYGSLQLLLGNVLKTTPGMGGGAAGVAYYNTRAANEVTQAHQQVAGGVADQLALQAAQQNLDAAQQMSDVPGDWKQQEDAYFAAQRQFITDQKNAGAITPEQAALQMRNVNQQAAVYGKETSHYNVTRQQKDLQDAIDIAKTTGNLGAQAKAQQALYSYDVAHAAQLKLSPADLKLIQTQFAADLKASTTPIPPPFAQNQPGVGALQAGPGSTAVRFGGGQDPQLEEIRQLRAENQRLRNELGQKLDQLHQDNLKLVGQAARSRGSNAVPR